jgi:hypothetical protein
MSLRFIKKDDTGVSAVVEYILTFIIASFIFSIMLLISYSMFIQGPQKSVETLRYTDVGNDMTAKIIDTYLIAPRNGSLYTSFSMPSTIAGNGYSVSVITSKNGWDKEIYVKSPSGDVNMSVTLDGVNQTIPISGKTSSSSPTHNIYYQSAANQSATTPTLTPTPTPT